MEIKPRYVRVKFIQDSVALTDIDGKRIGRLVEERNPSSLNAIRKGDVLVMTYCLALILNDLKMIEQTFLEWID